MHKDVQKLHTFNLFRDDGLNPVFVLISLTANVFDKKKDQGVRMLYVSVNTLNTQFDMLVSLH